MKILLIEDNELNRDMLSRRLELKGFQVVLAEDGERGVELTRSEKPDVVLMDMSLPLMDGWAATREIRADPAIGRTPIIALTAHAMAGDRERAIDAGCDDYDTKPVEFQRLVDKILALVGPLPLP